MANEEFSRRDFLKGTGALIVSFSMAAPLSKALAASGSSATGGAATATALGGGTNPAALDSWLAIAQNGSITIFTGKVDVGTGTRTALSQIAAEELDVPFGRVSMVMGDTARTVEQGPSYGSLTVRYAGPQLRHAAAAGREALLDLASERFGVPASRLVIDDTVVSVIGDRSKRASYADLIGGERFHVRLQTSGRSFGLKVAENVQVENPKKYSIVGKSLPRVDIPGKVTGQFTYVQDVKVEGMLHGRVVRPIGIHADLLDVDESAVQDVPGFVQIVRRKNFLGVVAETEWGAIEAARRLGDRLVPPGPQEGPVKWSKWAGLPEMDDIWETIRTTAGRNHTIAHQGNVDMAKAFAAKSVTATYRTPYQMHGSLGPSCAVAAVRGNRATIWSGTQMPYQLKRDLAAVLAIPADNVHVIHHEAAGCYGRNGAEHATADAAVMSQAVGQPVRVQWMRWDEHADEPKGPGIVQDLEGTLDEQGNVTAWRHHMWVPSTGSTDLLAGDLIGRPVGGDGMGSGNVTYAYTFPNADVAAHSEGIVGLRTSWLRSPAQFETTYAMESFIDELAAEAGVDPLTFRLRYLEDRRAIGVLRAAAQKFGWKSRPSPKKGNDGAEVVTGRGIAWVDRDDSYVATAVDVEVNKKSGEIRLKRVVVAHDCGMVINPDGLRNQVEGNIIQSASRTLHEEVTFNRSYVTSRDWAAYPILTFDEIPDSIDVVFVNNRPDAKSTGAGEPSTCPTAAVIGNAVFDATGARLRRTPFRPERVKEAFRRA